MCREIIGIYYENHKKRTNVFYGQNSVHNVTAGGTNIYR
jgi:hypothetical protein